MRENAFIYFWMYKYFVGLVGYKIHILRCLNLLETLGAKKRPAGAF
jgi:hypothetical protein